MKNYSFNRLTREIYTYKRDAVDKFIIGSSTLGEPIHCYHVGKYSNKQILIEAGIHAREYITSLVVMEELKWLANKEIDFGVYFIPLVNPDGARLVIDGIDAIKNTKLKKYLLSVNNNSQDFSLWKANILAVDLNSNFNALWGKGKYNKFTPAPAGFIGYYPNSEIENMNLINFIQSHPINGSLSIHSKGKVVYYGYDELSQKELDRDNKIAQSLASFLDFNAEKTQQSVGGFSDYVSKILKIPAFTIEVGRETLFHPISSDSLHEITPNFIGVSEFFSNLI